MESDELDTTTLISSVFILFALLARKIWSEDELKAIREELWTHGVQRKIEAGDWDQTTWDVMWELIEEAPDSIEAIGSDIDP